LVHHAAGTGLTDNDLGQTWEGGEKAIPNPARDLFTCWVFESRNLVQVVVIQHGQKRREGNVYIGEVQDPAALKLHSAGHMNCHMKRVTMKPAALVAFRYSREAVSRFERKFLKNFHLLSLRDFLEAPGRWVPCAGGCNDAVGKR
jgi:hypothetical protein